MRGHSCPLHYTPYAGKVLFFSPPFFSKNEEEEPRFCLSFGMYITKTGFFQTVKMKRKDASSFGPRGRKRKLRERRDQSASFLLSSDCRNFFDSFSFVFLFFSPIVSFSFFKLVRNKKEKKKNNSSLSQLKRCDSRAEAGGVSGSID